MAHSLSAKKRVRQNLKRRAINRARKSDVREQVKAFGAALASGDAAKAEVELRKTVIKLDRTAAKGTIHRKAASRKRSRLQKKVNALKAQGPGAPAARA
ncbi:MAG: 30S ribosomal protein S20 [Tepidisphaeraceae bacterium]